MRRCIALLAVSLFAPVAALAQNAPSPYTSISAFEVPLAESARFEESVRQIVDAAVKAKLKAQFGWGMWQNDNTYAVVGSMQKLAELDDPMMWMRQFDRTPGQPVLMQAFQKLSGMHYREEMEILQYVPEWSYQPATPAQPLWAEVIEYWPVAGSDEAFDRMAKEAMTILRSTNYPFMVIGNRTPVGARRAQFVVLFDDIAKHAAATARLEQNAQWQALGSRFMPLIVDMQTRRWRYRSELSYAPAQ